MRTRSGRNQEDKQDLTQIEAKAIQTKKVKKEVVKKEVIKTFVDDYYYQKRFHFYKFLTVKLSLQEITHKKIVHKIFNKYLPVGGKITLKSYDDTKYMVLQLKRRPKHGQKLQQIEFKQAKKVVNIEDYKKDDHNFMVWNFEKLTKAKWHVVKKCRKKCKNKYNEWGYYDGESFASGGSDADVYWAYIGFGEGGSWGGNGNYYHWRPGGQDMCMGECPEIVNGAESKIGCKSCDSLSNMHNLEIYTAFELSNIRLNY